MGESPEQTIWREIKEELCWQPLELQLLGNLDLSNIRRHVFHCELRDDVKTLSLQEGEGIGIFASEEILQGLLYSQKRNNIFISRKFSSMSSKN